MLRNWTGEFWQALNKFFLRQRMEQYLTGYKPVKYHKGTLTLMIRTLSGDLIQQALR